MDITTAAWGLLALRIISSSALVWVLFKQLKFIKQNNPPSEQFVRKILFAMTLILLLGNAIPIAVDVATILELVQRSSDRINLIGVLYTYDNATTAALSGIAWAILYWLIEKENLRLHRQNDNLQDENTQLHDDADKEARRPKNR